MNVFLSPIKEKELFFKRPSLPKCFNERVNKLKSSNHKIHDMLCQKKVKLDNIGRVWDYCWCWCCSFWKFDDGLLRSWYQFSNTLAVAWLMYVDSASGNISNIQITIRVDFGIGSEKSKLAQVLLPYRQTLKSQFEVNYAVSAERMG